jgi:hypothetical protein
VTSASTEFNESGQVKITGDKYDSLRKEQSNGEGVPLRVIL